MTAAPWDGGKQLALDADGWQTEAPSALAFGPDDRPPTALDDAGLAGVATKHGATPAQVALAWVVQQPGVTSVIPGARSVEQAHSNAAAGDLPVLDDAFLAAVEDIYDRHFRAAIHHRW